jgi:hypothetical protein
MKLHRVSRLASILGCAAAVAAGAAGARAEGTVRIQQANGIVNTYHNVSIKILHSALYLTSADTKGTLVINRAACFFQGEIMACLPTGGTLVQAGAVNSIGFRTGTIFLNLTDAMQQLTLSSTRIPPHSILLSLQTKRGTYINLNGSIDKVTK